MRVFPLLLLACASTPRASQLPPPPVLTADDLVLDTTVTVQLSEGVPGDTAYFGFSLQGAGAGPCPPVLAGPCLGIRNPQLMGTATVDAQGNAELSLPLPASLPFDRVWLQAATVGAQPALTDVIELPILDRAPFCIDCVVVHVEAPVAVTSPDQGVPISYAPDSQVVLFPVDGGVRGYVANATTWMLEGATAAELTMQVAPPVMEPGGPGTIDSCGAWLHGVQRLGITDALVGWYHAEGDVDAVAPELGCNNKKVAYAVSYDEGRTFERLPGSNVNVVLSPGFDVDPGAAAPGEGDHAIIEHDGYRYMYYLNTDPVSPQWHTSVARSPLTTLGEPGTWWKFYDGAWDEPGVGGRATKLGGFGQAASKMVGEDEDRVVLLRSTPFAWNDGQNHAGLTMTIGAIPIGPFDTLREPLIPLDDVDWNRTVPPDTELVAYPSAVPLHGGKDWQGSFELFYTYLEPSTGFAERFLVRRTVHVEVRDAPVQPNVRLALTQYDNGSDSWATTAIAPGYANPEHRGFLMTRPPVSGGVHPLADCVGATGNHIVAFPGECANLTHLRTLGWAWDTDGPGRLRLNRCYDGTNHHVTHDDTCPTGTPQLMGFVME